MRKLSLFVVGGTGAAANLRPSQVPTAAPVRTRGQIFRVARHLAVLMAVLGAAPVAGQESNPGPRALGAIVKIETTFQRASYRRPWAVAGNGQHAGSGAIIEGRRVITNAHVVSDATFVQVRRAGHPRKFVARVAAVSHELDLALLQVEDDAFFADVAPLDIGALPEVGQRVVAYGFPKGGSRLTITRGIVSRVDRALYKHSQHSNLVAQIDAAINPGSSGGPILDEHGRIAGIAFQAGRGENIGYMVPARIVRHFLQDLADGRVDGAPVLPVVVEFLENRQLRAFHGLQPHQTGILVTMAAPPVLGPDMLQPGDVILDVAGHDVGNDGSIELRPEERISFLQAVDMHQVGDEIEVGLLRDGTPRRVSLTLSKGKTGYGHLVPRPTYDVRPTYYVFGGLVFSPLTANYLMSWPKWEKVPVHLRALYRELRTPDNEEREQVIALIDVLADELNVGYAQYEDEIVSRVNGQQVRSMQELIAAFESHTGRYHRILLEGHGQQMVFEARAVAERGQAVLERYRVPSDRSPDLR